MMEASSQVNLTLCLGAIVVLAIAVAVLLLLARIAPFWYLARGVIGSLFFRQRDQKVDQAYREQINARANLLNGMSKAEEIRAQYDRQFHGKLNDEQRKDRASRAGSDTSPVKGDHASSWEPEDRYRGTDDPFKQRFREENIEYDDEMDSYFDDQQLD